MLAPEQRGVVVRLDDLGAPGTEYALKTDEYVSVSRARLVAVRKVEGPGPFSSSRPGSRRFAFMVVISGPYGRRLSGNSWKAPKGEVRVQGKHILCPWEEHVEAEERRRNFKREKEEREAALEQRFEDLRRRARALGIGVEPQDMERTRIYTRAESHLLVSADVIEGLLEHAEAATDAALGVTLGQAHGALLAVMREAAGPMRDRSNAHLPAAPLTLAQLAHALGWELRDVEPTMRDLISVGMAGLVERPDSDPAYRLCEAGMIEAAHEAALA